MATPQQAQLALTLAPPPSADSAPAEPSSAARPSTELSTRASAQTPTQAPTQTSAQQLWLCIYFPYLPLEVVSQSVEAQSVISDSLPLAVTEEIKGRPHILIASRHARAAGVMAGLSTAAALALCPELMLCPRQISAEQRVLSQLAQWSYQFTPKLSQEFSQSLLLEVKSSLMLFDGLPRLSQRIREGCQQQGYRPRLSVTPSPRASWILARSGNNIQIDQVDGLRSILGQLPLASLDLAPRVLQRLNKTGLTSLRDLWRLPRADLGRRYGLDLLKILDQISASQTQLLTTFEQPLLFNAEQDLPIAIESWSQFWPAIQHLLQTLVEFLQHRNAATDRFELSFFHANNARSELIIGLRKPSQNLEHLCLLVRERLNHYCLPASVIAVQLCTDSIQPYQAEERNMFQPHRSHSSHQHEESWQNLLDQLQARLGPDSIQTLQLTDDYRPECSQDYALYGDTESKSKTSAQASLKPSSKTNPTQPRPNWLLPQPKPLRAADYQIHSQSERIESGWWDQHPIHRDYHVATDQNGSRYWVFRELQQPDRWYLHGLFG
ncbi:MAG: DNA polymerase Y family protein [Pseudomonadales bacterium]|nr:DNA polymerase Y family protein [Pseudomonadales bacterium]